MASILVVCTGNVCRSPVAEGLLRAALERRFGERAPVVASAGTAGWEG
ncbi:MAG: arsenate reductase/protein-tyrosine-phosphatase family protein, partial [Actinomycetota bacterium]